MTGPAHRVIVTIDLALGLLTASCQRGDWVAPVVEFNDVAECVAVFVTVEAAAAAHEREANDGLTVTSHQALGEEGATR